MAFLQRMSLDLEHGGLNITLLLHKLVGEGHTAREQALHATGFPPGMRKPHFSELPGRLTFTDSLGLLVTKRCHVGSWVELFASANHFLIK